MTASVARGALAVVLLVLLGCADAIPDAYEEQSARWHEAKPETYSFDYGRGGGCASRPMRVTVTPDAVTAVRTTHEFCRVANRNVEPVDMDQIYAELGTLYEESHSVIVEYDTELHIPVSVRVDPDANSIDEEWGMLISNYVAYTGSTPPLDYDDAAALWSVTGPLDYSYTWVATGFCGEGSLHITVRDGEVAEVGELPRRCIHTLDAAMSIPDLLVFFADYAGNPEFASWTFDPVYGYPALISGELSVQMTDDQFSYAVVDFVAE